MLKIPLSNPYYAHPFHKETYKKLEDCWIRATGSISNKLGSDNKLVYDQGGERMKLVNDELHFDRFSQSWIGNMLPNKWYLFPEAFSLHLLRDPDFSDSDSDWDAD